MSDGRRRASTSSDAVTPTTKRMNTSCSDEWKSSSWSPSTRLRAVRNALRNTRLHDSCMESAARCVAAQGLRRCGIGVVPLVVVVVQVLLLQEGGSFFSGGLLHGFDFLLLLLSELGQTEVDGADFAWQDDGLTHLAVDVCSLRGARDTLLHRH